MKSNIERVQKPVLFPNKTMKNSENLTCYGIDTKKLDKISKSSYKESKNHELTPDITPSIQDFKEDYEDYIEKSEKKMIKLQKNEKIEKNQKNEKNEKTKKIEKNLKNQKNVTKQDKNSQNRLKSSDLFKESYEKIENMNQNQSFPHDFKYFCNIFIIFH